LLKHPKSLTIDAALSSESRAGTEDGKSFNQTLDVLIVAVDASKWMHATVGDAKFFEGLELAQEGLVQIVV
jgi:hypothetical protein